MKLKCPKGIFLLALFAFISSLSSIKYLLNDGKLIFFNFLLQGFIFQAYYLVVISVGIVIAIGLFLLKRWAFFLFLIKNIFYICMFTFNSLFVKKDMLLKLGWKNVENLLGLYRATMMIGIFFCVAFIGWIFFYRKYYFTQEKKEK